MHRTTFSRSVMPTLITTALCLVGLAQPVGAQTYEKTGTNGKETKAVKAQAPIMNVLVPLEIKLPKPYYVDDGFQGYMVPPSKFFDYASIDFHNHPRQPLLVPRDVQLISLNKSVTSSDGEPQFGELSQVTDGDKETLDGSYIGMHSPGVQWIQLDLGASFDFYAIVIWHNFQTSRARIYHDVVVRCSDDPDFKANVKTLFNNDYDNSSGLGKGEDLEYAESNWGKQIDCRDSQGKPARARFVRCYSNGSNFMEMNHYIEIEVYGRPVGAQMKTENKPPTLGLKFASKATSISEELVPLEIKSPNRIVSSYLPPFIEKETARVYSKAKNEQEPRSPFMAPKGVRLLSFHKKVTASDESIIGELEQVTDGEKEDLDGYNLELNRGMQWVQIDLGERCDVYAIVIWRPYLLMPVYHDVIVRCAVDPDLKENVKTLFNNDSDNSAKFGKGTDHEYVETWQGKLIDARDKQGKPTRARYIRCYSNGKTTLNEGNDFNRYSEIEVYGRSFKKTRQ